MIPRAFAIFVVFFCAIAIARADTATLISSHDTTLFQSNPNNGLGGAQAILIGDNAQSSPRRGLIQFNLDSIPAGSTINSVQVKLFINQIPGGAATPPTMRLYRLAADWGEGTAGNNTTGVTQIGQGFSAAEGDATWSARHFSATTPTLWTNPGGDFSPTDSASLLISGTTLNAPYVWGSTPALIADVQSWLDNPSSNFGWLLKADDETTPSTVRGFWSRESARTGQGGFSPQLLLTYTPVPEPASTLIALAAFVLASRRRVQCAA